jgi:hypothetical protein
VVTENECLVISEPKLTAGQAAQPLNQVPNGKGGGGGGGGERELSPSIAPYFLHFFLRLTRCSSDKISPQKFRRCYILGRNKGRSKADDKTGEKNPQRQIEFTTDNV